MDGSDVRVVLFFIWLAWWIKMPPIRSLAQVFGSLADEDIIAKHC